eukprot:gene4330-4583_t
MAAAIYLLLQDRVDDAERLLKINGFEARASKLADGDPLKMQNGLLSVSFRGIDHMTISGYQIDTELLFTTSPFNSLTSSGTNSSSSSMERAGHPPASGGGCNGLGKVAYVKPSATLTVELKAEQQQGVRIIRAAESASSEGCSTCVLDVDVLMPDLAAQSVLLEVIGGGVTRTLPRDSRGDEWFYKDGYTDLTGRFDYTTLTSTADMSRVTRFSLLVASAGVGAVMMQAAPPGK